MVKADTLPPIDAVERLMLAVGFRAIVSRAVERITKGKLNEVQDIGKRVAALANDLVNGALGPSSSPEMNYRATLKDLARGWDQQQLEATVEQFPPEYRSDGHALVLKANKVIQAMLSQYPVVNYVTVTGSANLIPDDVRIFKFVTVLEVIDDPLSVFSLMAEGALLQNQTKAVRLVYPTLSQAIDAAILEATIHAKADKKTFELNPRTEIGVKAWFGHGPVPVDTLRGTQAAVARTNARKAAQPQAPQPGINQADLTSPEKDEARP